MPDSDSSSVETLMGHPKGLFVLFFVELWERFSFYGMRALLVLYMTKRLIFTDDLSYGIYGAYGSLVYATPVIGGLLADRLLGYRRAIFLGAVLMAIGHFTMTFDYETISALLGPMATEASSADNPNLLEITMLGETWELNTTIFFYSALALLIIGNGFFKPNISSLVGELYDDDDIDEAKRDGGFTIFYMGINIGAFLAPLLCGYIGETYGWHYGFGLAGVGMVAGLVIFVGFKNILGEHGYSPYPDRLEADFPPEIARSKLFQWAGLSLGAGLIALFVGPMIGRGAETLVGSFTDAEGTATYLANMFELLGYLGIELAVVAAICTLLSNKHATYLGTIVAIPNIAYMVTRHEVMGGLLLLLGIGVLGSLFRHALKSSKVVRERLFVVLVLIFFSMTFWAFFEQAGSSINLFTDRNVDRVVFGWTIPTSVFQSVNPAFIIMLAPLFSWLWEVLSSKDIEPSTPVKFGLGILQLGLGFGILVLGTQFAGPEGMVALGFLLLGYMLHTTGELCLSPVGLSMVTKLSPKETVGVVMGAWFLSSSFAHYIAAIFASFASAPKGEDMREMAAPETLPIYADLFGTIGIIAGVVGVFCLLLSPILKKWMHGVN